MFKELVKFALRILNVVILTM